MKTDELYMQRALDLARQGAGHVSPNPLVGCVIVHHNSIIGEGWHRHYGGPHAEVNAINSVDNQTLLAASTLYVNLEPCTHFGKTPPCADLLIKHRIKRVVIANYDSNPLVAGRGVEKLKLAGIEVVTGICESEGHALNRRFFTSLGTHTPYVILKWAQTADGFIAQENYESKWISHALSRQLVHRWRTEEDAVLVGTRTAAHDNPRLNVREWSGRNPVRVVIDKFLRLSETLHLFDHRQPTLCYNVLKHEEHTNLVFVRVPEEDLLHYVLEDLHRRNIQSVIVEGGAHTLNSFIDQGLWHEARIFTSPRHFGKGIAAPTVKGKKQLHQPWATDWLTILYNTPTEKHHDHHQPATEI